METGYVITARAPVRGKEISKVAEWVVRRVRGLVREIVARVEMDVSTGMVVETRIQRFLSRRKPRIRNNTPPVDKGARIFLFSEIFWLPLFFQMTQE
jgi:hypothetical protein